MTTALNVQGNWRPMISVMVMTHRKASVQPRGDVMGSVNVDDEARTDVFCAGRVRWNASFFYFIWTIISTQLFLPEYPAHREIY